MKYTFILSFFLPVLVATAQERIGFKVGPQKTTCDSLPEKFSSMQEALATIEGAKYRFEESFKISRPKGLQAGKFLSCDGESGYLVVEIDDEKRILSKVSKKIWKNFKKSSNPGYYFHEYIHEKFNYIPAK